VVVVLPACHVVSYVPFLNASIQYGEFVLEQTLIIIKPDGVQRGLTGEIIKRFEQRGLRIVAMQLMMVSEDLAKEHYAEHDGKPFYAGLVSYITSGPVVAMVLEGKSAIAASRKTIGSTNPAEAEAGTLRGDFGLDIGRNLVHGSANTEDAAREVQLWFADNRLSWERDTDRWIFE
jgi:nucleoside-diphosphate kinase